MEIACDLFDLVRFHSAHVRNFYFTYPGTSINRPPDKSVYLKIISYFSTKTYVVGTQKNRLNEAVLLSTQNTGNY